MEVLVASKIREHTSGLGLNWKIPESRTGLRSGGAAATTERLRR